MKTLLSKGNENPKTAKDAKGIESVIMHLAPHKVAGIGNVCAWATEGCIEACLNTSGKSQIKGELTKEKYLNHFIHRARIERTRFFFEYRRDFLRQLVRELGNLEKRAAKKGCDAVARPNGTSDLPWEKFHYDGRSIIDWYPDIQFYDYTKSLSRAYKSVMPGNEGWPSNYHLTLSRSEKWSDGETEYNVRTYGVNVAVVFADELPDKFEGIRVIDGTLNDWRWRDPAEVVVGLLAKGRGRKDTTGFVIR
jgi:hypothetical protein